MDFYFCSVINKLYVITFRMRIKLFISSIIFIYYNFCFGQEAINSIDNDSTFINFELGYSISYPTDWFIKKQYRPKSSDTLYLEYIKIENKKENVILAGGGPLTENGTSFMIEIINANFHKAICKLCDTILNVNTIIDWINVGDIPEKVKHDRLKQVSTDTIGGKVLMVWRGKGCWASCGIEFVYQNKFFRFHFISISKEQYQKDYYIFEKMLNSFKLIK